MDIDYLQRLHHEIVNELKLPECWPEELNFFNDTDY